MAAPVFAEIDVAGIAPVRLRQRGAQTVCRAWHQDQVDMVVHQAPGQARNTATHAAIAQQVAIFAAIIVREKHRQPAVAALGDMMRHTGENDTGKSSHMPKCHAASRVSI